MTRADYILIFTSLGGMFVFIATVVVLSLKAKVYLDDKFSDHRKFVHEQFKDRDKAIARLEYWAILQGKGYQPGADPLDMFATGNGGMKGR